MVRIRLRRVGARHQPSYRIVAADKESPRDGRFLENLGFYNPRTEPSTVKIDEARLFHWLKHGAQPSDAVVKVLKPHGAWERWERFKGGEDIEILLKEAEEAYPDIDPRTRRDDLIQKRAAKKKPKKKEEVVAEAPIEAEPATEKEPEAEAEKEPEAEAEEISPAISEEEAKEEIVEQEEATEVPEADATAQVSEEEISEQPPEEEPAEVISAEDTAVSEVEADEEAEVQDKIKEPKAETSDDGEE